MVVIETREAAAMCLIGLAATAAAAALLCLLGLAVGV